MRRVLIIASIVIVLAGIGVFIYLRLSPGAMLTTFSPEGNGGLPIAGQQGTTTENGTASEPVEGSAGEVPTTVSPRLVKISTGPVVPGEVAVDITSAGEAVASSTQASSSAAVMVNYLMRESGNVFSYRTDTRTNTRTNNQTIPGIQSAAWLPDGSVAFVRYLSGDDLSTINTYALPASSQSNASSSTAGRGFFLPQNLSDIAVSPTGVLTIASGVNGSVAAVEQTDGIHGNELFSTPLSSIRASFAGKSILVFTKPSALLDGFAFLVSPTGLFSRIVGPQPGLTALASPQGTWVLASYLQGGTLRTELVSTGTGEIVPLPIATIADKCVWATDESTLYCGVPTNLSPNGTYPDDWYQGTIQFSDRVWQVNVRGRYVTLILDFQKETGGSLDAETLAVDPQQTALVFINKNDGSLWSFSL